MSDTERLLGEPEEIRTVKTNSSLDTEIENIVDSATREIVAVVRADIASAVTAALGGTVKLTTAKRGRPPGSKNKPAKQQARKAAVAASAPTEPKKVPADEARRQIRIVEFLAKNPKSRAEEIYTQLNIDSTTCKADLAALRKEGAVKTTGKARGTMYSASGKASGAAAAAAAAPVVADKKVAAKASKPVKAKAKATEAKQAKPKQAKAEPAVKVVKVKGKAKPAKASSVKNGVVAAAPAETAAQASA